MSTVMNMQVWQLQPGDHLLLIVQHHSITDYLSLDILSRELAEAYSAALRAAKPQWQPLSVAYVDYAAWQHAQLSGAELDAELAWWRQQLDGAPALLELPSDRPRPNAMSLAGADIPFELPKSAWQQLQQLAAEQQTTVFVVLLTALQVGAASYILYHHEWCLCCISAYLASSWSASCMCL
jgi:Condensation domain